MASLRIAILAVENSGRGQAGGRCDGDVVGTYSGKTDTYMGHEYTFPSTPMQQA